MTNTVIIEIAGIISVFIRFAINSIRNSKIGSITAVVAILPVYIIRVIKRGIKLSAKHIRFSIVSFTLLIMSEKFDIIIVTINMYCT